MDTQLLIILLVVYGVSSLVVALLTISKWKATEELMMGVPIGDMEYYEYSYGYGIENFIFLPSVVICSVYKFICSIF